MFDKFSSDKLLLKHKPYIFFTNVWWYRPTKLELFSMYPICMYICVYVCVYVCIYIYVCMYVSVYAYMYVLMHGCI